MSCRIWYTLTLTLQASSTEKVTNKAFNGWQHFFRYYIKANNMRSILYLLAVILIIGWLLGVFYWSATGLIHILIVLAIIALILAIIRRA